MNTKSLLLSGLLGLTLVGPLAPRTADAQITPQGGGYLLRLKFTKGQVTNYSISTSGAMMQKPLIMKVRMRVTDVKGAIATVENTVTPPAMGSGAPPKPTTETVRINNMGKVVSGTTPGMSAAATPTLPQGPIKIGQTWKGDVSGMQGTSMKATYKLNAIKTVGTRRVAEITMNMQGSVGAPSGSTKMTGTGSMNLDMKDGSMVSGTVNINVLMPTGEKGKTQNIAMVTRISRS